LAYEGGLGGDWLLWVLLIAVPATVIYAIGHLLGCR
jgi:hypothetical protein